MDSAQPMVLRLCVFALVIGLVCRVQQQPVNAQEAKDMAVNSTGDAIEAVHKKGSARLPFFITYWLLFTGQ